MKRVLCSLFLGVFLAVPFVSAMVDVNYDPSVTVVQEKIPSSIPAFWGILFSVCVIIGSLILLLIVTRKKGEVQK